ncbi:MAG: DUF2914 domain-containing protein [Gemmatimonadota bacterium]
MRSMLAALTLVVTTGAAPLLAQEPAEAMAQDEMQVTTAVVATDIEDREPIGVSETFPADIGELYFFTVFEGDFPETEVEHVWLYEDEEMARVPLTVTGPRWRTWSSKRLVTSWTGAWTVQVVDSDGTVLESVDFTVEAMPTGR